MHCVDGGGCRVKRKPRQTGVVEFIKKLGADTTLGFGTHSRESSAAWFP
jgi:hypothetical protein